MGVALYIALENKVAGVDALSVDGKGVADEQEALDVAARELGVERLSGFVSQSAEELTALADELGVDAGLVPAERWFRAEDGLRVVRALLDHARTTGVLSRAIVDLENIGRVLDAAAKAGVRFHLAIDI